MKKILFIILMFIGVVPATAQHYMRIWQGGESTRMPLQDIVYTNGGSNLSAEGITYATAEIDSITIVKHVTVTYSGNTATVDLGNSTDITYETDGAHVVLTNTNITEEMEVELTGLSTDGSFTYIGAFKCKIHLNGLTLTSTRGAAIDIENGKRIDLILEDGTTNKLTDASEGTHKAALYCKGHLEISKGGSLHVTGNLRHAIASNEYMLIKKSTGSITIEHAVSDAIHAEQYFQMNGGTLNISGMGDDGIQAEKKNDPNEELNGQVIIKGGTINMTVASTDTKGIKSDSLMTITGGTFNITASGLGTKGISSGYSMIINEEDNPTQMTIRASGNKYTDPITKESSRCIGIKSGKDLTISAGTITVTNTGVGSKGIKVDGTYYPKGGTVSANVDATKIIK